MTWFLIRRFGILITQAMGEVAVCLSTSSLDAEIRAFPRGMRFGEVKDGFGKERLLGCENCLPDSGNLPHFSGQCLENGHAVCLGEKLLPLPPSFVEYLEKSGVDPAIYSASNTLPRYIRLKPGFEGELPAIEAELSLQLNPVSWLQGFFSLPHEAQIAWSQAYQLGKIYGLDAASGAAVAALDVVPGDHVLDLCTAPGAKLCMITDLLEEAGTVTGVDISRHRLAACRTMLMKYGAGKRCRLFLTDGTKFALLPLRQIGKDEAENVNLTAMDGGFHLCKSYGQELPNHSNGICSTFGEWTSRRTRKEKQLAQRARMWEERMDYPEEKEPELFFYGAYSGIVGMTKDDLFGNACKDGKRTLEFGYDKVLVDVECTHDGSLKHISKYEKWGWDTLERRVLDKERLASITCLQLQLLNNGFRLLKGGGTLVYSTCSLTTAQNEDVVEKFLAANASAALAEIEIARRNKWPCKSGKLTHSLHFDPLLSGTSGLFIAKITKTSATQ
eukprot:c27790_g1_i1 orf=440-1945(+)